MGSQTHSQIEAGEWQNRVPRTGQRTVTAGGAVVAMAALLGMASPIGLANSISESEAGVGLAGVLTHPDAALVAPSHVIAWTAVTLAVCIFLSRNAQIAIARPALLTLRQPRARVKQLTSRSFLRASRSGGLYGG